MHNPTYLLRAPKISLVLQVGPQRAIPNREPLKTRKGIRGEDEYLRVKFVDGEMQTCKDVGRELEEAYDAFELREANQNAANIQFG